VALKNAITRTVQYWRLVDGRDGSTVDEVDWDELLRGLYGMRISHPIDGRSHAGTVYALDVSGEWSDALNTTDLDGAVQPADVTTTYGIVMAAGKDFVPNQEEITSGDQKPMGLVGRGWEPVDNLFVWFLPFGNMIGVLAESTSSTKAGKFADWLTRATAANFADPEFHWLATPVIDPTRAQALAHASGLRSAIFAGEFGSGITADSAAQRLFRGPREDSAPTALRLEVKVTLVRGKSSHGDEQLILDWFNENFGSLEGKVDKAQITTSPGQDTPPTEVDLLHHRLTRKTIVQIANGSTRSFEALSAVSSIIDAYVIDKPDLVRLRADNS